MKLRRGSTAEQGLQELEERRTKLESDLELQEAALADAQRAVTEARQLEATAVLDEPDPSAARKRRTDAESALVDATGDLDVLRRAIVELERRLDAKREEVRAEELAAAQEALLQGLAGRAEISSKFAASVERAVADHPALLKARENVKMLRATVAELGGDRYEHDSDEAEWPDVRELVEFLTTSKPIRPLAEREKSARKAELDAANAVQRERIRVLDETRRFAALSWPRPGEQERKVAQFFDQVPADLLDEARALYETTRSELLARPRARV